MKILAFVILAVNLPFAWANINKSPKAFESQKGKSVFVDFLRADYKVVYDVKNKKAAANSVITFTQREEGKPIFDLMESPISAKINGEQVDIALIQDPDKQTKYRLADKDLAPGEHTLEIEHEFSENIKFSGGGVASGFWMSDLSDRKYLEQYLPSNLEFDQFKMSLEVQIINASEEHEVFANGEIDFFGDNHFKVEFPSYFTTSSMFFHLTPRDRFTKKEFIFTSINGSKIPVMAYSKSSWSLVNIENKIIEILKELEEKLGAWGHPGLTVYIAGSGGMEHSGATITSLWALGHELTHSYFARGVMPIDGNSGWLDEAIASWRDDGYKASSKPFYNSAKMAGFSPYKRTTDRKAYRQGASFMAFLNHELKDRGGLETFLASMYENYMHKNLNTSVFQKELEKFSGRSFKSDFDRYVLKKDSAWEEREKRKTSAAPNPFHPKLSKKQLMDLL